MNRANYDRKTIVMFEIVGTYFVDVFYNELFVNSGRRATATSRGLTDVYRDTISLYMDGAKMSANYIKIIRNLHAYYENFSSMTALPFNAFRDLLLAQIIPGEYYGDFSNPNKEKTLRDVILLFINRFGAIIMTPACFRKIIDDHTNKENVIDLQERAIDTLIVVREEYYAKFASALADSSAGISTVVFNRMKDALEAEVQKRMACETERDRLLGMMRQLVEKATLLNNEVTNLTAQVAQLRQAQLQTLQPAPLLTTHSYDQEQLQQLAAMLERKKQAQTLQSQQSLQPLFAPTYDSGSDNGAAANTDNVRSPEDSEADENPWLLGD